MNIITTNDALAEFCSTVENDSYITIDTEFVREKTYYPILCLIQIAGKNTEAIIDPLAEGLDLAPVYALLQKPDLLKVFHACRQDVEIFYLATGTIPAPLYDTQIAAAVCGYGDSAGYETLVNKLAKEQIDKSSRYTDWAKRPLTDKQLSYALSDVTHLRVIYEKLAEKIEAAGRSHWIKEELAFYAEPSLYETKPEDAWKRLKYGKMKPKQLAALRELARWRETEAQIHNVPRPRIAKDDMLVEIAHAMPHAEADISRLRYSGKMLAKKAYAPILECVQKALKLPKEQWPESEKKDRLPPELAGPIAILKLLLKVQSEAEGVSASIIASKDDIESIALGETSSKALYGWRADVFGDKAKALLEGKLSLSLDPKTGHVLFSEI